VISLLIVGAVLAPLALVVVVFSNTSDSGLAPWLWTHIGPDYEHSVADRQAADVCLAGTPTFNENACQQYTETSSAAGYRRIPTSQGGACELTTRFDCAQKYHLPQWDKDVPIWQPQALHNGLAGMAFTAGAGTLIGIIFVALAAGYGYDITLSRAVGWPAIGGLAGAFAMDALRHQGPDIPMYQTLFSGAMVALAVLALNWAIGRLNGWVIGLLLAPVAFVWGWVSGAAIAITAAGILAARQLVLAYLNRREVLR
jgi:hypothetical protein